MTYCYTSPVNILFFADDLIIFQISLAYIIYYF